MPKTLALALALAGSLLAAAPAAAADKLTVLLDWFVNPDHAPLLVAEDIGAFAEAGLDVEIVPPADPAVPPRLVAAGQADIAISYQPQLYFFAEEGLPLVRIGTLIDTPLNTVIALKSSGIRAIADLKGRKVGFSVSGIEEATLGDMLQHAGLSIGDVTMVNVNFQLVASLLAGQVDAVIGGYRNIEVSELVEQGADPVVFNVEDHGVPTYDELVIVANRADLGEDKLKRFLAALAKGTAYLRAHPDETWTHFAAAHPELDTPVNRRAWSETIPHFAEDPFTLDVARYEAYGRFLADGKVVSKLFPIADYAVELKRP
ncbi:ABC transporter substrate-binding protein [Oharaeibacter diazotrophicus]|uniref:Putative hydroxymethylpyrimidine transport system substrate-binding protein n=1 Tax=Oharaeibacter diazotrophicus TaxID=1920512 RepID=A0A4R6RF75_9HYPH|nr:ABC transporter substrate-binding protein [Oharaeibacter diazotrophicus]TDP84882.1 putative hydroxymethylpyrimidine transport system substrate-binding protein [Oharaeibacter diazotrophicus]BBE73853.1 putative thiamine biosynthesis protein [Pleomorphomonas sp. SM30]GLS76462.1 ABC transporter ATP-binding protein [Oharaeibacter diazotrophicus]